jgi:hypothetical protein
VIISSKGYDGAVALLSLLGRLNMPKAWLAHEHMCETWACINCGIFVDDCNCEREEWSYDAYNDEASFE